jgi:glucosamine kinase
MYLGVDGGASKTRVVVIDAVGAATGYGVGPAATLNGTAATAWTTILDTISEIEALADIALADCAVVVGIAGTEIATAYRSFVERAPACAALHVVSDAHIACAGAHELADGAIVAVGTGVVGFCRDGGTTARVGGWGFPHDDRGSGAWLGMEAVAAGLAAADGRRVSDVLSNRVLADFDTVEDLSAWACTARAGDFACYARLVVDLAAGGEAGAEALLHQAAGHVSLVARALVAHRAGLPLALTGGLADTIASRLDADLLDRLRPSVHDAATGAALMARHTFMSSESDQ